jgi:hypothetical protein
LDISCWRELANYLAIHLSNTELQWPYWDYWSGDYSSIAQGSEFSENGSLQITFFDVLIGQCTRLSLPEKLMPLLPTQIHHVVPKSESEYTPHCVNYLLRTGS